MKHKIGRIGQMKTMMKRIMNGLISKSYKVRMKHKFKGKLKNNNDNEMIKIKIYLWI